MADSTNWRNLLQELLQKHHIPVDKVVITPNKQGPPHDPTFQAQIKFPYFRNTGSNEIEDMDFTSFGTFKQQKEAIQNVCQIAYLTVKDFGPRAAPSPFSAYISSTSSTTSTSPSDNFKGKVLEHCQKRSLPPPTPYIVTEGPSHQPSFRGRILWNGNEIQSKEKFTIKKLCEQHLYQLLWEQIANKTQEQKMVPKPVVPTVLTDANLDDKLIESLVNTKPRSYQIELYKYAIRENSICVLPTGTGKTLTACMVIKRMKHLNPKRIIVFVVDRIPLLIQQSNNIREETGLEVLPLSGGKLNYNDPSLRERILKTDVVTITCDTLHRLFENHVMSLDQDISLLIFDEAQHAIKNSPFARIMKQYYLPTPGNFKPKILGLTASPAAHQETFVTIVEFLKLQKMLDSKIRIPESSLHDLVIDPSILVLSVPQMNEEEFDLSLHIENAINEISIIQQNASINNNNNMDMETDEVFVYQPTESKESKYRLSLKAINDILDHFGTKEAVAELKEFLKEYDKAPLQEDIARELRSYTYERDVKLQNFHATKSKAVSLIQFLKQIKFTVGIVFTQQRKTAEKVHELIHSAKIPGIKPELLLGHDGKNSIGERMTPRIQRQIVERLNTGQINLVVATSVAEEGLDLKCDLVIRFDAPNSAIARIQSRGRARLPNSTYVIINREDEASKDAQFEEQEANAKIAIDFIQHAQLPDYVPPPSKTALQDMMEKLELFKKQQYELEWESKEQITGGFLETAILVGPKRKFIVGSGQGQNKKEAKNNAAKEAMTNYKLLSLYQELVIPSFPELD